MLLKLKVKFICNKGIKNLKSFTYTRILLKCVFGKWNPASSS